MSFFFLCVFLFSRLHLVTLVPNVTTEPTNEFDPESENFKLQGSISQIFSSTKAYLKSLQMREAKL